jgi:Flp pilus assembly protein TadG
MKNKFNKMSARGQGLLEFALLVPLLVLIVFGAIDLARAYHAQVTITNASREGARLAMRINNLNDTQANKLAAIRTRVVAEAGDSGIAVTSGNVTVVCGVGYSPPCTSGAAIRVTVQYQFNLLMGAYFIPSINLSHFTEMVTP